MECIKCKDRGTVYRDGKTAWCDCTTAQVLRGSLKTIVGKKQTNRGRKRKPTEEAIPTEPLEKSIPTFFGLALKGWKTVQNLVARMDRLEKRIEVLEAPARNGDQGDAA